MVTFYFSADNSHGEFKYKNSNNEEIQINKKQEKYHQQNLFEF